MPFILFRDQFPTVLPAAGTVPAFRLKEFLVVTFPFGPLQDLGKYIAVPLAAQEVDVMGTVHSLVRHHYRPPNAVFFFKTVQIFFQRIRIAHIPPEDIHTDRDPIPIQEKPHLDDRCQLVLFGHPLLGEGRPVGLPPIPVRIGLIRIREILLCIVVCHVIKGVFQTSVSQPRHFPMQVLLKLIEKVVKLIQCPVDIGEFELTLQPVIIQKPGGRFPLGGRIEDPVYDEVAENFIQGVFPTEPGTFLIVCDKRVNPQEMVHGLRKFITIVQEAVVIGIHPFRERDLNAEATFFLKAIIAGIDLFPERVQVCLVFQVAKTFYSPLFRGRVGVGAVAFCDTDLSFNRTVFKSFFIFPDHSNLHVGIKYLYYYSINRA